MEDNDLKNIIDDINYLAEEKNDSMIKNILFDEHPSDIAIIIKGLWKGSGKHVFNLLDADTASDVIMEFDESVREKLISDLRHERISEIVDEMPSDDATDFVAELPEDVAEKVLESIDEEDSSEVKELLRHEEDTAGGIMAKEFVSVFSDASVDEAIREIRTKADEVEEIYNVYATDSEGHLAGFIPLKKLLLAKSNQKVKNIMVTDIVRVPVGMDQEEVANIFRRYDMVSTPVVDEDGKLIGRITIDDIVDVMHEEAAEDMQKMAGIADEEEIHETSVIKISFGRLPWLLVGLVGQLAAAYILKQFEASLKEIFIATFFIPLMMAMGGNSGIQSATIVVRGLALGELNPGKTFQRLGREVLVSLFNGTVCGVLLFAVIAFLNDPVFGFVLAFSMLLVMLNATVIGASVPLILRKAGIDPAIATGPLITTFNDIIGISIYLGLLTFTFKYLHV